MSSRLFEMMRIKGLGSKKLSVLWNTAGIDTVDALIKACKNNTLSAIPEFGIKTQENIISSIEATKATKIVIIKRVLQTWQNRLYKPYKQYLKQNLLACVVK